jgi:hypothetical protein
MAESPRASHWSPFGGFAVLQAALFGRRGREGTEAADPCGVSDQAVADAAYVDDPVFACGVELAA